MFDLVEEDLATKEDQHSKKQSRGIPSIDAVVYTMPEKFRRTIKTGNNVILFIALGVLILGAVAGTVVYLIVSQKQAPLPPVPPPQEQTTEEKPSEQAPSDEQQPSEPTEEDATSTENLLPESPSQEATSTQTLEEIPALPSGDVGGIDTDSDGLTDAEERLYNTNSQVQDTDGDGFSDGEETSNLFDPMRPGGARLEISGLVNPFTNRTFSYSLYYPSSWSAKAVNQSDREVVISSSTGEFVSLAVQDNPSLLSAVDWYISFVDASADTSQLKTLTFNNWSGVMRPDQRGVYLVKMDETGNIIAPHVYTIIYNPNTSTQPEFQTTFMTMVKSFVFTDLSFVR